VDISTEIIFSFLPERKRVINTFLCKICKIPIDP